MNYKPNIGDIISFNDVAYSYIILSNGRILILKAKGDSLYKRGDMPYSGNYDFFKTRTDFTIYSLVQDMGI